MHQPVDYVPPPPDEIDVDGRIDARGVRFIGKAKRLPSGRYLCLADVGGCLCRVEAIISYEPGNFMPRSFA